MYHYKPIKPYLVLEKPKKPLGKYLITVKLF